MKITPYIVNTSAGPISLRNPGAEFLASAAQRREKGISPRATSWR